MKKLLIFFGGPGSGKTTFAREFAKRIGAAFYDGDDSYTLSMREEGRKSAEAKEQVQLRLYSELLQITGRLAKGSNYVCLTHSFNENKWKDMFLHKYKDKILFIYVKPDEDRHLNMLFDRERPDSSNDHRTDSELRELLHKKHIVDSNTRREYPKDFVTITNEYDNDSYERMVRLLSDELGI